MSTAATPGPDTRAGHDETSTAGRRRHTAGIFDVRNIIGLLLGIYGVVLTIMGAVHYTATDRSRTDNVNLNLWTGLALLLVGVAMITWALVRPTVVDDAQVEADVARKH